MKRQLINLAVMFCVLLGISTISQAQSNSNCFAEAAKRIKPGKKITLIKQDGSQISGQLQSIDTVTTVLQLNQFTQIDSGTYAYQISDITKIKFKQPGKFKPEFSFLGLLVGGAIGAGIGAAVGGSDAGFVNTQGRDIGVGIVLGGGVGFLLGTLMGLSVNSTRIIECE